MRTSLDKIYKEALRLPDESKAILAERIIEYLETSVDPDLERLHLDTVKRRRDEMRRGGQVMPIDGQDASVGRTGSSVNEVLFPSRGACRVFGCGLLLCRY